MLGLRQLSAESVKVKDHVLDAVFVEVFGDVHVLERLDCLSLAKCVFIGALTILRCFKLDAFLAQLVELLRDVFHLVSREGL